MKFFLYTFLIIIMAAAAAFGQHYKVLESTSDHVKVEFDFANSYSLKDTLISGKEFQKIIGFSYPIREAGDPWLPAYYIHIGVPVNSNPIVKIISVDKTVFQNKFIIPLPKQDSVVRPISIKDLNEKIYGTDKFYPSEASGIIDDYFYRYSRIIILNSSPFQFNPVSRELVFNKKIVVEVDFGSSSISKLQALSRVNDPETNQFIQSSVVNSKQAIQFTGMIKSAGLNRTLSTNSYWYNPNKNYLKIYVKNKGLYRVAYNQLAASGAQINDVPLNKLELYNNGAQVPIYVADVNNDGVFDAGDYFEFVGYPPPATPYCYSNIYNNDNVYFFSVQADSSGLRYKIKNGYSDKYDYTYQTSYTKLHFERDSLFENLGYAGDDHRDFWLWDNISGQSGSVQHEFNYHFVSMKNFDADSAYVTFKVQLQGLTTSGNCGLNHRAYIILNGKTISSIMWSNQNTATFDQTVKISNNDFHLYPTGNVLEVVDKGDACPNAGSDEAAVNWFEIDYWKDDRADTNHIEFSSPPNQTGIIRYWTYGWQRDTVTVFIPQENEMITKPLIPHDQYNSVLFVDTVNTPTDYFCAGNDYFLTPDSIVKSIKSDLRSTSNGADYIIIANPDFKSVAERLANFRQTNFPDTSIPDPRIKIVYVNQIYNEFSNGLLDPYALQDFVKYAFYNWQKPSPSYVVLLGDMSHDYRHVLTTSRPDFVPSIPYYTPIYGEGVSDNMIVAVSGNDVHPDLAIGRLSCETVAEGNVLVDKLINYPADNTKEWKQNVLLISSGLSQQDEEQLGLNYASDELRQNYVLPNGFRATMIMRYPDQPDYVKYEGSGPQIRQQIDNGTVLTNFYGHGGGYQWDLTFLNDDIYLLNNGGRLPLILSLTCYTAHFDDQNVFGEQFNKVPGKGCIGFFGNVGLTYWLVGTYLDGLIFNQFFNKRDYISGKVFQNIKDVAPAVGYTSGQIALLTYLGDPAFKLAMPDKPDFRITDSDITTGKENAVVNETLQVKVKVQNLGVVFPGDSVTVQLFVSAPDTSYQLPPKRLPSFALEDSVYFTWVPNKADLYSLTAKVNETDIIPEADHSDNSGSVSFAVFNLNNPNIISPIQGYSTKNNFVDFKIAGIGAYISNTLEYYIQIDTNLNFQTPISSPSLTAADGLVTWRANNLKKGIYYWRSRIYNGQDSSSWSVPRTFSIQNSNVNGYYISGRQMNMFDVYNMNLTDSGLVLNSSYLPPRPSNKTFLQDVYPSNSSIFDSTGMTAITTDGKYIYFGLLWYYAGNYNKAGDTRIYKIGTGFNGTIKGRYYGTIPNFFAPIRNSMFYFRDGYIYVATGNPYFLLRVSINTGDTLSVHIPEGMIRNNDSRIQPGDFYLAADSNYVYDLAVADSTGDNHYVLRTLDPAKNWQLARPDIKLLSTSYQGFTGFFVSDGYLFPYENYESGFMRRIRISDGYFEEEWVTYTPFQGYYAWCYDWQNNLVYASVYRQNTVPKISIFKGKYLDVSGNAATNIIGPAGKWNSLSYSVENFGSNATYNAVLLGQNYSTLKWDTLKTALPDSYSLSNVNSKKYEYLKMNFTFTDSTFTGKEPVRLNAVSVNYSSLPDISVSENDIAIVPDTALQGVPVNINIVLHNYGLVKDDSANVKLYLNSDDSAFYSKTFSLAADSSVHFNTQIQTSDLISGNTITAKVNSIENEFYTFNNIASGKFFIAGDTTSPSLNITSDGQRIYNGDIISAKPKILISLKDNSPFLLDTTDFSIIFDNNLFIFNRPDVHFSYNPYPHSEADVTWTPTLTDGEHTLSILAKDHSGNYADSSAAQIQFYVYNQSGIRNFYNYPDPFKFDTYFTFQLTGSQPPDELYIRIFTVAGRLIRTINVMSSKLKIGFNKVYWDGRDQDGDIIANGVYFYKIIYKNGSVEKSEIQKLAKIE